MRHALARRSTAVLLAALCVAACDSQPSQEKPDSAPPTRQGNDAYALPDSPFTRKGVVVGAACLMGARYAAVSVQAWNPDTWRMLDERFFAIPDNGAFSNVSGVKSVHSPLVDLCRQDVDNNPSPYGVDTLESMAPRIRALFDLGYTRMAVVLRDPESDATHAGVVEHAAGQDDFVRLSDAARDDEQNAVMSPDGRSVWFTYTAPSGEQRIGSRAVEGDHRLSDEGPAAGHGLPLTVSGKPPRAIQADMTRLSPNGRRFAARAPKVFGNVFDTPDSSGPLTGASARNAALASDCVGTVGWIGDGQVLCRASSGSFQVVDAQSGRPVGAPIGVVGPYDGTIAEGMLVSADGKRFIVLLYFPDDRYGREGQDPDFRVVPTTPEGKPIGISDNRLGAETVFLEWR